MGRSRGGLTTKIHALVDANGLPIRLKLTEGQAHDGRSAEDMLDTLRAGNMLLADRACDSNALRAWLAEREAGGNIRARPSSGSSINSNTSVLSPPATTNGTITISLPLISLH